MIRSPKIFVIEDEPDIRNILCEILTSEGYDVQTAANGQEALTKLDSTEAPDLILLDLMMPVMNGMEFIEQERAQQGRERSPIIIMSADNRAAQKAVLLGARGCIKKPIELEDLLLLVKNELGTLSN